MSENILVVKGLTKDYGDFVLDKLTFTVPKGVIMGLIGENGAGKSTTINCILNEISKTDGNIEIFGKDYLSEEIEIKDKIGVVFDENHFPDIFTPNLFYLPKKRLAFEFIIFHGKEVAFVNLALFNDGTAFAYLPVLPCDFFLGAYPFARFIIEHAACGSLDVRLRKQFSFAEDKMDMIIGFAFVVVEG